MSNPQPLTVPPAERTMPAIDVTPPTPGALVLYEDRPDNADPLDVDAFLIQVRQAMYAESARRPIDST